MKKLFVLLIIVSAILMGCTTKEVEKLEPPSIKIETNTGVEIENKKGTYSWTNGRESIVADAMSPNDIGKEMEGAIFNSTDKNSVVKFNLPDNMTKLNVYKWSNDSRTAEVDLNVKNEMPLPTDKGKHVYEAFVSYEEGEVSYTFVLVIE